MTPELTARLLGSIHAGRLALICGAGLSMAPPSKLLSAKVVANRCFDLARTLDPSISTGIRDDLEAVADHFFDKGTLESVFIRSIVPWTDLVSSPNLGHQAVADFLLTSAADHATSTNYDQLIELSVAGFGADFIASLDGAEAVQHATSHRPLLKIHGCGQRDRDRTVWTRRQLDTEPTKSRLSTATDWLTANIREKDLVVIGFWSDWAYLNALLEKCLVSAIPSSVIVVDPSASVDLESKAPDLWRVLHANDVYFHHEQASGAAFLDELRAAFSRSHLEQAFGAGKTTFEARFGVASPSVDADFAAMTTDELYAWRRDLEGARIGRPARDRVPRATCEHVAFVHLAFRRLGAIREGVFYKIKGETVRVINGAGRWLTTLQQEYAREAPALAGADVTVCAGADDYAVPAHILRSGTATTIMRAAVSGIWLDTAAALDRYAA